MQAFRRRVDVGESVTARDEGAVVVIVGGRGAGYFERTVGILIIDEGFIFFFITLRQTKLSLT